MKKKLDFSNRSSQKKSSSNSRKSAKANDKEVLATIGTELNNDICDTCGDGGDLLCCDNCPSAFHFFCINPPVDDSELPEGDWYCTSCDYILNGKDKQQTHKGMLGSVLNYLMKENPKEFSLPPSVKKNANEFEVKSEFRMMDILELIAIPSTAAYRYTPEDKSDSYRKRKISFCSICQGDNGDFIKCTQCKKYYHKWCLEPPCFEAGEDWICDDHNVHKKIRNIIKKPNITKMYEDEDDFDELLNFSFERKHLPSFLVKPIEEVVIIAGKDDSDDEFTISTKRSSRRSSSGNSLPVDANTNLNTKSNDKSMTQKKSKPKEVTPQDLDPRTKKWFLKKMRVEHELLINQLSQFIEYCSSPVSHKDKMIQNLTLYQPIIPREVDISVESVFANYVKHMNKKNLIQRKEIDSSMLIDNIDDDLILFLAKQRINQIVAQKSFQAQFPIKKSRSKSKPKSDVNESSEQSVDNSDVSPRKNNAKKKRDYLENDSNASTSIDEYAPNSKKIRKANKEEKDTQVQSAKVSPTNKLKLVISTSKNKSEDDVSKEIKT